eukprot:gene5273-3779_t
MALKVLRLHTKLSDSVPGREQELQQSYWKRRREKRRGASENRIITGKWRGALLHKSALTKTISSVKEDRKEQTGANNIANVVKVGNPSDICETISRQKFASDVAVNLWLNHHAGASPFPPNTHSLTQIVPSDIYETISRQKIASDVAVNLWLNHHLRHDSSAQPTPCRSPTMAPSNSSKATGKKGEAQVRIASSRGSGAAHSCTRARLQRQSVVSECFTATFFVCLSNLAVKEDRKEQTGANNIANVVKVGNPSDICETISRQKFASDVAVNLWLNHHAGASPFPPNTHSLTQIVPSDIYETISRQKIASDVAVNLWLNHHLRHDSSAQPTPCRSPTMAPSNSSKATGKKGEAQVRIASSRGSGAAHSCTRARLQRQSVVSECFTATFFVCLSNLAVKEDRKEQTGANNIANVVKVGNPSDICETISRQKFASDVAVNLANTHSLTQIVPSDIYETISRQKFASDVAVNLWLNHHLRHDSSAQPTPCRSPTMAPSNSSKATGKKGEAQVRIASSRGSGAAHSCTRARLQRQSVVSECFTATFFVCLSNLAVKEDRKEQTGANNIANVVKVGNPSDICETISRQKFASDVAVNLANTHSLTQIVPSDIYETISRQKFASDVAVNLWLNHHLRRGSSALLPPTPLAGLPWHPS